MKLPVDGSLIKSFEYIQFVRIIRALERERDCLAVLGSWSRSYKTMHGDLILGWLPLVCMGNAPLFEKPSWKYERRHACTSASHTQSSLLRLFSYSYFSYCSSFANFLLTFEPQVCVGYGLNAISLKSASVWRTVLYKRTYDVQDSYHTPIWLCKFVTVLVSQGGQ